MITLDRLVLMLRHRSNLLLTWALLPKKGLLDWLQSRWPMEAIWVRFHEDEGSTVVENPAQKIAFLSQWFSTAKIKDKDATRLCYENSFWKTRIKATFRVVCQPCVYQHITIVVQPLSVLFSCFCAGCWGDIKVLICSIMGEDGDKWLSALKP